MSNVSYRCSGKSGQNHIGATPEHWVPMRLRFAVRLNPSKSEVAHLDEGTEVSFLPMDAIGEDGFLNLDRTRKLSEVRNGYTYFRDGDVVLAKITPCFENGKGAVLRGLKNGFGFGTTELIVLRPIPELIRSEFLHWVLCDNSFRSLGEGEMLGAGGQKRVPDDFVRNYPIALPPLNEQDAIVSFLDEEVAKIDELIETQIQLIKLLEEKKQATVSHAFTLGINTNRPVRHSGVDWLGDVPAHWSLTTVGRCCTYISYGFTNPMPVADDGPLMLTANDVEHGSVNYEDARRTTQEAFDSLTSKSRPAVGDVLVTKDGTLGRVAIHDGPPACINQSVALLRPDTDKVTSAFLSFCLMAGVYQNRMLYEAGGSTIKHIYISRLAKMPFACPSLDEQAEIIQYVTGEWERFGRLINESSKAIVLLRERRGALVSAAVSGVYNLKSKPRARMVAA